MPTDFNARINYRGELVKWANDTEKFLHRSISNKGLIKSGKLNKSISKEIQGLTTEIKTFTFKFSLYGMYVDMGLFGGSSLANKKDAALVNKLLGNRKRKSSRVKSLRKKQYQWQSRTLMGAMNVLGDLVREQYGNKYTDAMRLPTMINV